MTFLLALGAYIIANSPKLIGFIMPPIVEYLNKDVPNDTVRFIVSFIACIGAAVLLQWSQIVNGGFSQGQMTTDIGIIFVESQIMYNVYFKESYLRQKLQGYLGSQNALG